MAGLFDTHAHLTDDQLNLELEAVLERAKAAGVERILSVATNLETSRTNATALRGRPGILVSYGVHPGNAGEVAPGWEDELDALLRDARPAAVGECGLDNYHADPPVERQLPVLRAQVRLARKHGLPLVLHTRKASWEVLKLIEAEGGCPGVFHCIEADEVLLRAAVNAGFYLGVGGTATYPRNETLRDILPRLPRDRILLETDSPYLAPQAVRGKRNEPAFVVHTAQVVAEALDMSPAELAALTTANAAALFRVGGGARSNGHGPG